MHYFIKMLHDKGLLLRMYTQNIDGLERCKPAWNRTLVQSNVGQFLFPLLCMFLLCKSVTFHRPKSWYWNCISNSCATSCYSGPNVISLKPSLWNVTLVRENNGKETFLFPELWSFWPAAWIESSGCRLRIMGKHSLYIHKFMRLRRKSEVLWFAASSYGPT